MQLENVGKEVEVRRKLDQLQQWKFPTYTSVYGTLLTLIMIICTVITSTCTTIISTVL